MTVPRLPPPAVTSCSTSGPDIFDNSICPVFKLHEQHNFVRAFLDDRKSCVFGSGVNLDPVLLFRGVLHGTDIEVLDYYCERIIPVDTGSPVLNEFTRTFLTAVTQWLFVLI